MIKFPGTIKDWESYRKVVDRYIGVREASFPSKLTNFILVLV